MSDPNPTPSLPLPVRDDDVRRRLAVRRSVPAQALTAPGPDEAQLDEILTLGLRTPDHGKLAPWRFVVLGPRARADVARDLTPLAEARPAPDKARATLAKLVNPPVTVMVVSAPVPDHKVPVWEQELSAGAACMNLSHAANALGFATNWITDWYSFEPFATPHFGLQPGERIAGFIHMGSAAEPPLERPRPTLEDRVSRRP